VRRQDSAVGVCDGKAEFAGAILRAERGDKQEKEGGIDQGDLDQNTAQMDSPRSAGRALGYFTATTGEVGWTEALLFSGGRGEHDRSEVRHSVPRDGGPRLATPTAARPRLQQHHHFGMSSSKRAAFDGYSWR